MSVLLILVPSAFALAGATGSGVAVAGGASAAIGLAMLSSTVAGMTLGLAIKHGQDDWTVCYETHLTRTDLLASALDNLAMPVVRGEDELSVWLADRLVIFKRGSSGVFEAIVSRDSDEATLVSFFESLYCEYSKALQLDVYQKIKRDSDSFGFRLENERLEEDGTITLTFLVGGGNAG
jgi:hypothetical protein